MIPNHSTINEQVISVVNIYPVFMLKNPLEVRPKIGFSFPSKVSKRRKTSVHRVNNVPLFGGLLSLHLERVEGRTGGITDRSLQKE